MSSAAAGWRAVHDERPRWPRRCARWPGGGARLRFPPRPIRPSPPARRGAPRGKLWKPGVAAGPGRRPCALHRRVPGRAGRGGRDARPDRRQGLAWLTREVNRLEAETGTEAYYLPRYGETVEVAGALAERRRRRGPASSGIRREGGDAAGRDPLTGRRGPGRWGMSSRARCADGIGCAPRHERRRRNPY